uniref:Transmembrane transport n=1 Tax=Globodera pallida TaxID=36090 RepID=A0A183BSL9_GLOPA
MSSVVYTAGKLYTDKPHNHLRGRRLDYALTRFNIQGCKVGLKLGIGIATIVSLILVPTAFRDHFSLLNVPLATMMVFGANTTFRGWGMVGWRACVPATIYAVSCPVLAILCGCAYHRCLPDTFYWRMKADFEHQMRVDAEYKMELIAYASDRGYYKVFRYMPWTRRHMERERELGTWRWTSGVEDGLVHLEEEEEENTKKEPDQKAAAAENGDKLDEEEEAAAKLMASLAQRRRAWWRLWP